MSFLDNLRAAYGTGGSAPKPSASNLFSSAPGTSFFDKPISFDTSREAGFPDRIDLSPNKFMLGDTDVTGGVDAAAALAKAPAFLRERPVAAIDTLIGNATGVKPADEAAKFVKGIPILGPLLGAAGDVLMGKPQAALANALQVRRVADNIGKPDSTTFGNAIDRIGPEGLPAGATAVGAGRYSRPVTLGELRRDLYARGITPEDIAAVVAGTKSEYDFGDHPISTNAWSNLSFQLLADPTNLLLLAPGVGEAKAGALAARLGLTGAKAATIAKASSIFEKATASGLAKTALDAKQAARAIAAGLPGADATLAGLGQFFNVVSRGGKSLSELGITGGKAYFGIKGQVATATVPVALDFLADHTDKGTPIGGFFEQLRSVGDQIQNDRPLSDSALFTMYAAMNFPLRTYIRQGWATTVSAKNAAFGAGELDRFAKAMGVRKGDLVQWAGGKENVAAFVDFLDEKIALKGLTSHPLDVAYLGSMEEAAVRFAKTRDLTAAIVADMRAKGEITMADRAAIAQEWYTAHGQHDFRGVRMQWDPELAMKQWGEGYLPLASHLQPMLAQHGVTLGLNDAASVINSTVSKESISSFMAMARRKAVNGYIQPRDVQALLDVLPLQKLGRTSEYWDRILIRDAKPVSLKSLEAKLGKMKAEAPALSELLAGFTKREKDAPRMPRGMVEPSDLGNVLEGPEIAASRMRPDIANEVGLQGGAATDLTEAQAARSHPTVQHAEREVPKALAQAGFPVQQARRTLGGWDGGVEPSFLSTLKPMPINDLRLAASLAGHVLDQDAVLLKVASKSDLAAAGVKANSRSLTFENLPSSHANEIIRLAARHFPDGFAYDQVRGVLEMIVPEEGAKAALQQARRLEAELKAAVPQDALGGASILGAQKKIYAEWVGRDTYGSVIDDAVRAADPRVYAFDALSSELAGASERAAHLALSEGGGSLGGGLGLGGSRLPRTPRDWGDVVPGEIAPAGGSASPAQELRGAVDAQGFGGASDYVTYAAKLDKQTADTFPLPKERARPADGPEFFDMDPAEYERPLVEAPTEVAPAQDIAAQVLRNEEPGPAAAAFQRDVEDVFGLDSAQAEGVAAVAHARAVAWARETGRAADEWYGENIAGIYRSTLASPPAGDTLFQGASAVDVRATGRGGRPTRAELEPLLNQPAPAELQAAGLGEASPLEWHPLEDGSEIAIPGGFEGEFSLWDAWRLKSQQIDPNLLPRETRVKLYEKLFRSQRRELSNPVDAFNRVAFAQISPQLSLLKNEAGLSAIRATSVEDIARIAEMPLEDLVAQVKSSGAASVPIRQQLRTLQENARRFVEQPEWFNIREGEDLISYSERVMSVLDGAGMKVGNFSAMLGDPLSHNRGTIDSHMVELLVREGLVPEDVAARALKGGKGIAPGAQAIPLMKNGKPNPDVPEHLRDLPWQRKDGKVLAFGRDYKAFSDALDAHLHAEYPDLPFRSGGGQWFLWDMERGIVEPHTTIWPGSDKLPKMEPSAINAAQGVAKEAGYFRATPEQRTPYDPSKAVFWQDAKGATQFLEDGRAVIHAFEKADVSTAVHEVAHVFRRDLQPDLLAHAEEAFGVTDGVWTANHEEAFARSFERYLRDGKAPTQALGQVFKQFKVWLTAVYQRLLGTPLAGRMSPQIREVFDTLLTPDEGALTASQRAIREAANAGEELGVRPGVKVGIGEAPPEYLVKQDASTGEWVPLLSHREALAEARQAGRAPLAGMHPSLRNFDPETLQRINELEAFIRENYPRYRLEKAPAIATGPKPKNAQQVALKEYNAIGDWLFNGGRGNIFSPVFNFMHWAMTPKGNLGFHRAAEQALMSEVIGRGGTAAQVEKFLSMARLEADSHSFGSRNVRLFRDWSALPANTINRIAVEAGLPASVTDALGPGKFHLLVDRATSRFYRNVTESALAGGRSGQISRGLQALYDTAQTGTGVHYLYDVERATAKVFYHIFRFVSDPRWWMYNILEADTINAARYGIGSTRLGGEASRIGDQAAFVHGQGRLPDASELARSTKKGQARGNAPAGQKFLFKDEAPGHYSGWNDNRNLATYIIKAFDGERAQSTGEALRNLGENHPVISALRDRFGESVDEWVKGVDETMYRFDTLGVKGTVDAAARELEAEGLMSIPEMRPFIEQIYNRNQQLYDDIVQNLHGNAKRTNLERMLNSYWLYWPISYQLKAGKWLLDVMTEKFAGKKTNLGGLVAYENLVETHKQGMATDEEYAKVFNDNPELWFAAQMLLPITPNDLGVSLSRPVRYAASFARDVTGGDQGPLSFLHHYKAAEDPVIAAAQILNIGPIYTWNQFQDVLGDLQDNGGQTVAPHF